MISFHPVAYSPPSGLSSLNDAYTNMSKTWFSFTNLNAPSGYRAISVYLTNTSLCPLLYVDEAGTIFVFYDFAKTTLPSSITAAAPYYINNAGNVELVSYAAASEFSSTARIKVTYRSNLCRGAWFSLNGRANFNAQLFVAS